MVDAEYNERSYRALRRALSSAKEIRTAIHNYNEGKALAVRKTVVSGVQCFLEIEYVIESLEKEMSRRAVTKLESFKAQPEIWPCTKMSS